MTYRRDAVPFSGASPQPASVRATQQGPVPIVFPPMGHDNVPSSSRKGDNRGKGGNFKGQHRGKSGKSQGLSEGYWEDGQWWRYSRRWDRWDETRHKKT